MSIDLEQSPSQAFSCVEGSPYLFSTDDFYRMVDLDIFPKGNRASLWDGLVYEKPPKTTVHAAVGSSLLMTFFRADLPSWFPSFDNSITIGLNRAPAPDIAVLRGTPRDYLERRPNAADAGLLVEMNDEILRNDIARKRTAYASVGIPEYWVLDLDRSVIDTYTDPIPAEGRYASVATFAPGESIPLTLDGRPVAPFSVAELLVLRQHPPGS
jgi:Uma2 family endonuclease